MVQVRLLPLLAATFALHFTGRGMMALYQENQKKMAGDAGKMSETSRGPSPEEIFPSTDLLADLHATSCGLKALASTTAAEGLEVCRRACGGHGYSSFSGIGSWYADYLPTTTWEGDNYMLTQQVARYLLKSARSVLKGNPSENDTIKIFRNFLSRRDMGAACEALFWIIPSCSRLLFESQNMSQGRYAHFSTPFAPQTCLSTPSFATNGNADSKMC